VVFLFAGISDSKVHNGPVRAGIIVLGGPESAFYVSNARSPPDDSNDIILRQHFGPIGFVAAVKVQVESFLDG
jgi:hypothetical protein